MRLFATSSTSSAKQRSSRHNSSYTVGYPASDTTRQELCRAAPRVNYIYTMSPVFIEYDVKKIHYASSTQNLQAISTERQYYVEDKRHITLIACLFFLGCSKQFVEDLQKNRRQNMR